MICDNTTRRILEKSDIVKDCKYILYNSGSGLYNSGNGYNCKIALNKRKMKRCKDCYFAIANFPMSYL